MEENLDGNLIFDTSDEEQFQRVNAGIEENNLNTNSVRFMKKGKDNRKKGGDGSDRSNESEENYGKNEDDNDDENRNESTEDGRENADEKECSHEGDDEKAVGEDISPKKDDIHTKIDEMYQELILQINCQNQIVELLKEEIYKRRNNPSTEQKQNILINLESCLDKEIEKLQCLLRKLMDLQDEDPQRTWSDVKIATTFEEDNFPLQMDYGKDIDKKISEKATAGSKKKELKRIRNVQRQEDLQLLENFVCCLNKQANTNPKYQKSCDKPKSTLLHYTEQQLDRIICALRGADICQLKLKSKLKRKYPSQECGSEKKEEDKIQKVLFELLKIVKNAGYEFGSLENCLSSNSVKNLDRIANDNSLLEIDSLYLQEELTKRDQNICNLQNRIKCLQKQIFEFNQQEQDNINRSERICSGTENIYPDASSLEEVKSRTSYFCSEINQLEEQIKRMKIELECLKNERNEWQCTMKQHTTEPKNETDNINYDDRIPVKNKMYKLQETYKLLLNDYNAKEAELCRLKTAAQACINESYPKNDDQEEQLRKQITVLHNEQEKLKSSFVEQAKLLEDYRSKYGKACQECKQYEEMLCKIEKQNKAIESQINDEIQRIKDKFHNKLKDLAELPTLIENEQEKVSKCLQEKYTLENKLFNICKRFKELQEEVKVKGLEKSEEEDEENWKEKFKIATEELANLKKNLTILQAEKDKYNSDLQNLLNELDALRTESAKEIANTNEKSNEAISTLKQYAKKIEKEISECRLNSSKWIEQRECMIKDMKTQLNTLSCSFNVAQQQIKKLTKHITELSTGKHI